MRPRVRFFPMATVPEAPAVVATFHRKKAAERELAKAIIEATITPKVTGDCRTYVPPHGYGPIEPPRVTLAMLRGQQGAS